MLVGSDFCIHEFYLLDFDTDDVVLFDTKYFSSCRFKIRPLSPNSQELILGVTIILKVHNTIQLFLVTN